MGNCNKKCCQSCCQSYCVDCSTENLNNLAEEYDNLNAEYTRYLEDAMEASNQLMEAMENLVHVDCEQNEVVDKMIDIIHECLGRCEAYTCTQISQRLFKDNRTLQKLYSQVTEYAEESSELLEKTDCVGTQFDETLSRLIDCIENGLEEDCSCNYNCNCK